MKMWQLKKLSTNESLNDPQPLPENWRNIFGLQGVIDKLGDLTWAGHPDTGWVEVDVPDPEPEPLPEPEPEKDAKTLADEHIAEMLEATLQMVALDNQNMTRETRVAWLEYRRLLREVSLHPDYPNNIYWPARPE